MQNYKFSLVAYVVRGLNVKLLIYSVDESNIQLYDEYKRAYAEVLHRWRLLDARAQVTYIYVGFQSTYAISVLSQI